VCDTSLNCYPKTVFTESYNKLLALKYYVTKLLGQTFVQGGAEPTDTFQMVIDNIWKQEKISETVYKYAQVCYLLPTDYKIIF